MNTVHGGIARAVGAVIAVLAAAAAIVVGSLPDLNGDVRYALGCLETAGRGGVSVWDIFVSRPLAYKLAMAGLDSGRELIVRNSSGNTTSLVIRIETYVIVLAVIAVLYVGIRRVAGRAAAAGIAVATGLALIVAPPWHFLEPDWVAALLAVLTVGAACAPRWRWLGGLLAGVTATLVVAVKASTFPIALIALLLILVLDRRRAAWAALFTAISAVLWFLLTKHYQPWEWTWLSDLANLVHSKPQGIHVDDLLRLRFAIGDAAVLTPVIVLAPAAAAVLIRRQTGRRRWLGALVAVVAGALSLAPAYGQGEFYNYHFASTVVLAAGVCGAAFALCPGFRLPLALGLVLATGASLVLLHQPADWRLTHAEPVIWTYEIVAIVLAVAASFLTPSFLARTRLSLPWSVGVVALCFTLLPPVLLGYPYSFGGYNFGTKVGRNNDGAYAELSSRIGRDTPVLYLSYGSLNHAMGNPTTCRYPSPLWLQRAASAPRMLTRKSYYDNLKCLVEDSNAKYLILQNGWFSLPQSPPEVQELIKERFDCSAKARVPAPTPVYVCPARE